MPEAGRDGKVAPRTFDAFMSLEIDGQVVATPRFGRAHGDRRQGELRKSAEQQRMTREEITSFVTALSDVLRVLEGALAGLGRDPQPPRPDPDLPPRRKEGSRGAAAETGPVRRKVSEDRVAP